MVKYGERLLQGEDVGGEGVCGIPLRLPMNNGTMETVQYM